ncbi:glycerol-3-phosphate 1-O-acyltransferase PlsY [candidate division WOR-3 bacterium]|uniref:Glycerol-3-phosphate acyltransferase n=1 Tax=candidate division WOR-3 bacterium TaxID=2052148 RepID=A0A9D5K7C8_UNCW3|nr:glycerol-3-phosphate 1-O-acyltransferase PlsY [candidate division WOR-3 bacterium]MBD3363617.1 glycerol-3-phosphate 1-O-acyltransferase PlsY [candidate division WOR-3 bacterium]
MISPAADTIILAALGYLAGSIPVGYLIAHSKGVRIRKIGSGNIGATNAIRALGTGWGVFTGILDALKGALPALAAAYLSACPGVVGAAAVLGHIFSPWLRFNGGKGVATTLGVFLVLTPFPALAAIGIWIILFLTTGYVSLASILSIASLWTGILVASGSSPEISRLASAAGCAFLILFAHRSNIFRLVMGKEKRSSLWERIWKPEN